MAKMADGHADDLASTVLLATDKPVLIAPAMNPQMWAHPATRRNLARLRRRRRRDRRPECRRDGRERRGRRRPHGRAAGDRRRRRGAARAARPGALAGRRVLVTSGPTHEPIDPVRYIANRSSGKQGHAIAAPRREAGADVTLVVRAGEPARSAPASTSSMSRPRARCCAAVEAALPADVAIFAAAVADWRVAQRQPTQKIKKGAARHARRWLVENPDILATVAASQDAAGRGWSSALRPRPSTSSSTPRPSSRARAATGSSPTTSRPTGVMGGDRNTVHLVTARRRRDLADRNPRTRSRAAGRAHRRRRWTRTS